MGITFPILPKHVPRFFEHGKHVFVKFIGREIVPPKLHPGSKLFFYESHGKKEIIGEAKIASLATAGMEEILSKHGGELFLTAKELEEYAGVRKGKKMIVFVLSDVKRYTVPLRLKKSVTMAGQYMTRGMLKEIQKTRVVSFQKPV